VKLFVCTPVLNGVKTLDRTIKSVVQLEGKYPITYYVKDGNSVDGTIELLQKWESRLRHHPRITFAYSSATDSGIYDAVAYCFDQPAARSADWLTWINADDYLLPRAGKILEDVNSVTEKPISWVGGKAAMLKMDGKLVVGRRPVTAEVLKQGLADGENWEFLQQEGTFFKRKLWDSVVDVNRFRSFRLAGDWYLWKQLAEATDIYLISEPLGVFCQTENQQSSNMDAYREEIESIIPFMERRSSLMKKVGISSRVKYLYPTERGLYLRTNTIAGHYLYRINRVTGAA